MTTERALHPPKDAPAAQAAAAPAPPGTGAGQPATARPATAPTARPTPAPPGSAAVPRVPPQLPAWSAPGDGRPLLAEVEQVWPPAGSGAPDGDPTGHAWRFRLVPAAGRVTAPGAEAPSAAALADTPADRLTDRLPGTLPDPGELVDAVAELTGHPVRLLRDVVIGMPGDQGVPLVAETGDFWFHTDAAFLPEPPRWMVISVLEADQGGGLDLLPAELIDPGALAAPASYPGHAAADIAPVLDRRADGTARLRYRRDRMLPSAPGGEDALDRVHRAVEAAAPLAVPVGELVAGESLLVDNWSLLHRRRTFLGRRVIRRLWLEDLRFTR